MEKVAWRPVILVCMLSWLVHIYKVHPHYLFLLSLKENSNPDCQQYYLTDALSCYLSFPVATWLRTYNAQQQYLTDKLFLPLIGCNMFMNLWQWVRLNWWIEPPGWPANTRIYLGACFNVLACYISLLRINLSYIWLSPFPLIAISFVIVLCIKFGCQRNEGGIIDSRKKKEGGIIDSRKKEEGGSTDDGETRVIQKKFQRVAILPHLVLCAFGMIGDADHDGYDYDISQFLLFLTSTLAALALMMMRLPANLSRGIAPASQLLCKASLLMLLVTVHMVAADAFGKDVVRFLLPEVIPLLLWYSVHLDRRSPIINVNNRIFDWEPQVLAATVFMYLVLQVPADESTLLVSLIWAIASCVVSAVMMYAYLLVLRLWPEKVGTATLSFDEAEMLLKFWRSVLLKVAVILSAIGGLAHLLRWYPALVMSWVGVFLTLKLLAAVVPLFRFKKATRRSRETN